MTTWTTTKVPSRPPSPGEPDLAGPWTCVNGDEGNPARRRRCHDCGTLREPEQPPG